MAKHTIWANVVGYSGYLISIDGVVLSMRTNSGVVSKTAVKILKADIDRGYERYNLAYNGAYKHISGHRAVCLAFIKNPLRKRDVNHINGVKNDNKVENLEWATQKENEEHSWKYLGKEHSKESCMDRSNTMRTSGAEFITVNKPVAYIERVKELSDLPFNQIQKLIGGSRTTISKIVKAKFVNGVSYV